MQFIVPPSVVANNSMYNYSIDPTAHVARRPAISSSQYNNKSLSRQQQATKSSHLQLYRVALITSIFVISHISFFLYTSDDFISTTVDDSDIIGAMMNTRRQNRRMLFGIFTYDSPNEYDIRKANRDTHLRYFKTHSSVVHSLENYTYPETTICSLQQLMHNATLVRDPYSCRYVYTFVMGGGIGDEYMKRKVTILEEGRDTVSTVKTRCLWEDPQCGGTDITKWTLARSKTNISDALADELTQYNDVTFLSIPENHEVRTRRLRK
eukprot:scaffold6180_cov194-Alexandrium_tamarense.AAC.8